MQQPFDTLARPASAVVTKRRSFTTLGGAAAMAAIAGPLGTQAGKKRCKKKKCKRQVEQCLDAISAFCGGEESCENNFPDCCLPLGECKAGASLDCVLSHLG